MDAWLENAGRHLVLDGLGFDFQPRRDFRNGQIFFHAF